MEMELSQARKTIAAYVAGQAVPSKALAEACRRVHADPHYVRYLLDEFGLLDDWVSECEMFRSRLAEFCDMSLSEHRKEAPELLDHLEACSTCQRLYWSVKPLWTSSSGDPRKTNDLPGASQKSLAEAIRVVLDPKGVGQIGCGPPPQTRTHLAVALDDAPTEPAGRKHPPHPPRLRQEWLFHDQEAGCAISLAIERESHGDARVLLAVATEADSNVRTKAIQIEAFRSEQDLPIGGPLADFQPHGLTLQPGAWTIRLREAGAARERQWTIPICIEKTDLA